MHLIFFVFLVLMPVAFSKFWVPFENQLYYNRGDDKSGLVEAVDYCASIGGEAPHDFTKDEIAAVVATGVLQPTLPATYQFFWLNGYNDSDALFRWTATGNIINDDLWAENEPTCTDGYVCRVVIESRGSLYAEPQDRLRGILCHIDLSDIGSRLALRMNLNRITSWEDRKGIEELLKKYD